MAVSVFMLFFAAMISFIVIISLQLNIQQAMDQTSRSMGKMAYLLKPAQGEAGSLELDSTAKSFMSLGINPTSIKLWLLGTDNLRSRADASRIKGKSSGLYTFESEFDEQGGILDMVVSYDYSFPWLPESFGTIRFVQRMKSHVWTGKSLVENGGGNSGEDGEKVYVTPNGTVYHLDSSCNYLDLSIHSTTTANVSSERNASGSRYERCTGCTPAGYTGTAYITDYGTNWHSSLGCSGLKRTVIESSKGEVEGMRACSKCGGH